MKPLLQLPKINSDRLDALDISKANILTDANQIINNGNYIYLGIDGFGTGVIPLNALITDSVRVVNLNRSNLTLRDQSNTNTLVIPPLTYAEFAMINVAGPEFNFDVFHSANLIDYATNILNLDLAGGYQETVTDIGNSGTSKTLSLTGVGTYQIVTATGNCTYTMPAHIAGKSQSFILKVLTGAGGFTGTFTGVKYPNNIAPTLTATASRYDLISFSSDGAVWSGSYLQNYTV